MQYIGYGPLGKHPQKREIAEYLETFWDPHP
jgi:hypothetical protein